MKAGLNDKMITTLFRVPNTIEGHKFIQQMRKYRTGGTKICLNGRGERVKPALANGKWRKSWFTRIPLAHAEYFAIYITKPAVEEAVRLADRAYIAQLQERIVQASANPDQVRQQFRQEIEGFKPKTRRRIEL